MESGNTAGLKALILQLLLLAAGIGIILLNNYRYRGPAVTATGVFFINLFWVTMVLGHDLKIWSWLRNTKAGGLILLGIVVANFFVVVALAVRDNFFK